MKKKCVFKYIKTRIFLLVYSRFAHRASGSAEAAKKAAGEAGAAERGSVEEGPIEIERSKYDCIVCQK